MSSLVIFERNGITARWNKGEINSDGRGYYTVHKAGQWGEGRRYPNEEKAVAAAKRAARRVPAPRPYPYTVHDAIALARAFADEVKESFSTAEFREMLDKNKSSHADKGICASHDYCDANMLMLDAWLKTFGREPALLHGCDHDDHDARLWGDAWAIAKAADFFA
jgi:hypothetical protein